VALYLLGSEAIAEPSELAATVDEEVTIKADSMSYDQKLDALTASGNVVIRRGAVELKADEVRLNQQTEEAEAIGNVTLSDPDGIMFADRMQVNLETETGELYKATLHARKQKYTLSGDIIRKGEGQTYHIENGTFTTCECESGQPTWSVGAETLDVALGGYGKFEGAHFNILGVPVLRVPEIALPVSRERQSGLLVPRVGFSNRRGLQILQPVYWAINKSEDATIGIDIESSARVGLVGEYRYAASRNFEGTISASYFNEAIRGSASGTATSEESNPNVPENRWDVLASHTQRLGSVEGYADVLLVGDDLFLREINTFAFDYDEDVDLRTRPFTESRVGFIQRWNRMALQGEGVYYQDLVADDDLVLQRVPEVRLFGQKYLGAGVMGRLNASTTDFLRREGIDGARIDLEPGLVMRLPLGRSFSGSLYATLRETLYQLSENEMSGGFRGDNEDPNAEIVKLPRSQTRATFELGGEVSTAVGRVFDFPHLGFDKIKHVIQPRLEYLFIPNVAQDDVMVFDGLDRIEQRSLFTYGFSTRLLARKAQHKSGSRGQVLELTRLSLSQSYDVERTLPSSTSTNGANHFSDVDVNLRVNPDRDMSVRFVSSFDPVTASFSTATIGVRLLEPLARVAPPRTPRLLTRTSVGAAYRFVTSDPLITAVDSIQPGAGSDIQSEGIQEIDSNLTVRLTDRLGFRYASRYNLREGSFLENHFGLRLISSCDCWGLDIGVTDKSNPNEVEFRAQLSLVGLGGQGLGLPFGFY